MRPLSDFPRLTQSHASAIATAANIPISAAPLTRLALRKRLTAFGNRLEGVDKLYNGG
jgi:hypothetical protein